jgi:hypothetical protein
MKDKTEPRKATPRKVQQPGISKPELVKRLAAHIGLPAETIMDGDGRTYLRFGPPGCTLLGVEIVDRDGSGWHVASVGGMPSDEQARIFRIHKQGEP